VTGGPQEANGIHHKAERTGGPQEANGIHHKAEGIGGPQEANGILQKAESTANPQDAGGLSHKADNRTVFVDTDRLAAGVPLLEGLMQRISAIREFTGGTIGSYRLDGGDEYYTAFAKVHDPLSRQVLEGLENASSVFGDSAGGTRMMLHNYAVTEDNNIETSANLLGGRLDG
jgi:hypothetical protein